MRSELTVRARAILVLAFLGLASGVAADKPAPPAPVQYREGLVHGFLALTTLEGETLAAGDLIQQADGDRVTSRLLFTFKDGSRHDETTVFSQKDHFRVLSYRLVQQGPAFKRPMEVSIDMSDGKVTVAHEEEGKERVESERMDIPPNLANGLVPVLLKNVRPAAPAAMSFVAATPKPRLVKLHATSAGEESFSFAGSTRKAQHYVVKVDLGGVTGILASLLGKQPPDTHVWILTGDAPAFLKSEGPLYAGGPIWRIELTDPVWPEGKKAADTRR